MKDRGFYLSILPLLEGPGLSKYQIKTIIIQSSDTVSQICDRFRLRIGFRHCPIGCLELRRIRMSDIRQDSPELIIGKYPLFSNPRFFDLS